LATVACLTPVALGFFIPFAYLLREVIARGLLIGFDPALLRHSLSTVLIATCATASTLALGFGAVLALRLLRRRFAAVCVFLAGLGYAVPGTVLALGLLSPLIAIDEAINWLTGRLAGVTVGLVITGSSAAIVIAYTVRFLAIATGFAQAGLARIPRDLDDAARSSGARPGEVVRGIHLPLLRPALWGAALLIFVDCLKELPATLLLRPLNVETLATYTYQFATRGNFEEGSLAAILIVAVGIFPVIRMVRHADDASHERVARLAARRQVPDGILRADQPEDLGMVDEDVLELTHLPGPAVPLGELVQVRHLRAGALGERCHGLACAAERGAVQGRWRRHEVESSREQAGLLAAGLVERWVVLRPERGPQDVGHRPVGTAVADQVEAAGRGAHRSAPPVPDASARRARHSSAYASRSSVSQIRPDARAVSGSGNDPRSRYVITRRLSHPMISAASATPAIRGITSTVSSTSSPIVRRSSSRHPARDVPVTST
jgi:ABC-type spermidine/putrescine transport system permease subunit II